MTTGSGIGCTSPLPRSVPSREPPFYAVPVLPGDVGTYGGVVTDEHARVLREDGSVIEGLYATGVSTASVMGTSYPGAGSSVGPSFVWGYVAAKCGCEPRRGRSRRRRTATGCLRAYILALAGCWYG